MPTLKCAGGCGATAENHTTDNSFVWANKNGWGCYSDVSNGLTLVVTCPQCDKKLTGALRDIFEVFGEKSCYIHFGASLRKMSKDKEEAK